MFEEESVEEIVESLDYDYCDEKFDDIKEDTFYPYNPEDQQLFWNLERFHPTQKYRKVNDDGWRDASKETELGWTTTPLVTCLNAKLVENEGVFEGYVLMNRRVLDDFSIILYSSDNLEEKEFTARRFGYS